MVVVHLVLVKLQTEVQVVVEIIVVIQQKVLVTHPPLVHLKVILVVLVFLRLAENILILLEEEVALVQLEETVLHLAVEVEMVEMEQQIILQEVQ